MKQRNNETTKQFGTMNSHMKQWIILKQMISPKRELIMLCYQIESKFYEIKQFNHPQLQSQSQSPVKRLQFTCRASQGHITDHKKNNTEEKKSFELKSK